MVMRLCAWGAKDAEIKNPLQSESGAARAFWQESMKPYCASEFRLDDSEWSPVPPLWKREFPNLHSISEVRPNGKNMNKFQEKHQTVLPALSNPQQH